MYKINVKSDQRILAVCNSGMMAYSFDGKQVSYLPQGIYCFDVSEYKRFYFDGDLKVFPLYWENLIGYDIENINYSTMEQKQVVEEVDSVVAEYNSEVQYSLMYYMAGDSLYEFDDSTQTTVTDSFSGTLLASVADVAGMYFGDISSTGTIGIIDYSGSIIWSIDLGSSVAGLDTYSGDLLVTYGTQLARYADDGTKVFEISISGSADPTRPAVDSNGNIFVLDRYDDTIYKYDSDGNQLDYFGASSKTYNTRAIAVVNDVLYYFATDGWYYRLTCSNMFSDGSDSLGVGVICAQGVNGYMYVGCDDSTLKKIDVSDQSEVFSLSYHTTTCDYLDVDVEKGLIASVGGGNDLAFHDLEGNVLYDFPNLTSQGDVLIEYVNPNLI